MKKCDQQGWVRIKSRDRRRETLIKKEIGEREDGLKKEI